MGPADFSKPLNLIQDATAALLAPRPGRAYFNGGKRNALHQLDGSGGLLEVNNTS